jgi:soluble lytic murein transglycosylase
MRRGQVVSLLAALMLIPGTLAARVGTRESTSPADRTAEAARLAVAGHAAHRAGRAAEARRAYLDAARHAPEVEDWLLLRAARLTPDSLERRALYARVTTPVARAQIPGTEAAARELAGDLAGAAVRYDSLGRATDALRVRLQLATTASERAAIRRALVSLIDRRPASGETIRAMDLLLARFAPMVTPDEALGIARAATELRQFSRANAYYPRGLTSSDARAADRVAYGRSLLRAGRPRDALTALLQVRGAAALRAEAELERAKAQLKLADRTGARATLDRLVERYPTALAVLPQAYLLMGDLAWDAGDADAARTAFLELGRRFPTHEQASRARFLAALVAWEQGQFARAATEWEQMRQSTARADAAAAGYWAGRAWQQLGDESKAHAAWMSVRTRDSLSYYGVAAAERLGIEPWAPLAAADRFEAVPDVDSALVRMTLLERMELAAEVGWEREWLIVRAAESAERGLATAHAFRQAGQVALAARLARGALAAGAPSDARTYRLIYAFPYQSEVRAVAAAAAVDPLLVAALIRQESTWDPSATSSAGARGLMQVMPQSGAALARQLRLPAWHADSLYSPGINLQLGTTYLADALARHQGELAFVLAAYNAGPSRVTQWSARFGTSDKEFWIERVPFTETRDYIRIIRRNLALYRALYPQDG